MEGKNINRRKEDRWKIWDRKITGGREGKKINWWKEKGRR